MPKKNKTTHHTNTSGTLEIAGPLSLTWKVRVPNKSQEFASSTKFRFRNLLWHLECGEMDDRICVVLFYQGWENQASLVAFVSVESGMTGLQLPTISGRWNAVLPDSVTFIWMESKMDVERADPAFKSNRQLIFRITIEEDIDPSESGEEPPSGTDAAVQTSPSTSTSPVAKSHLQPSCSVSVQTSSRMNSTPCLESLSEDLENLLVTDSDPDIELHCDGRTFKAHKNVLSVRSPVLKSMLHSDMVEGKTGVVDIQDMDVDSFQRFLRYLYTGRLDELTVESATSLYEAGDMFEVLSLVGRCSKYLVDNLTMENACDVLAVADAHSDEEMAEAVIVFILEKKLPLSDDLWSGFCDSHPKLANKVFARFCKMLSK